MAKRAWPQSISLFLGRFLEYDTNLSYTKFYLMKISKDTVATFHYRLTADDELLIEDSFKNEPLTYLHGHQNLIIGMENALENKREGDKFSITIPPEEAYGQRIDEMVQLVPITAFDAVDELFEGMRFTATTDAGDVPVVITQIENDQVTVDGNHPLAGQTLNFSVEILSIRPATAEEIEHGHVHGAGGHHH
ncbi:MAG: peptidylprolyl isomerase [Gammaproteobacteria bacterium CG22_combo_CG10-13_8_21_14_all_40_8]|nr:MAG: peptidylprolyl isomerase [Gammaproteobacteria bacterium CG22_combo_CG10-13_8_21_14_all_40_8]